MGWYPKNVATDAAIAVAAEAANAITVTVQLKRNGGANLAAAGHVHAFLSSSAAGTDIAATAPETSVAIGAKGKIIKELTT